MKILYGICFYHILLYKYGMLRNLDLKIGYDNESDDIVQDFFIPCMRNCTMFSKSTNFFSVETLTSIIGTLGGTPVDFSMNVVTGRTFHVRDFEMVSNAFLNSGHARSKTSEEWRHVEELLRSQRIIIRIASPHESEDSDNTLEEIGFFKDSGGDVVLYDGIISKSFLKRRKKFETIDVFTSWEDESRLQRKRKYFQDLWRNNARRFDVYDFMNASKNGLIKYSFGWAIDD